MISLPLPHDMKIVNTIISSLIIVFLTLIVAFANRPQLQVIADYFSAPTPTPIEETYQEPTPTEEPQVNCVINGYSKMVYTDAECYAYADRYKQQQQPQQRYQVQVPEMPTSAPIQYQYKPLQIPTYVPQLPSLAPYKPDLNFHVQPMPQFPKFEQPVFPTYAPTYTAPIQRPCYTVYGAGTGNSQTYCP